MKLDAWEVLVVWAVAVVGPWLMLAALGYGLARYFSG